MPQSVIGNLGAILGIETGQFESGLKILQGKLGGFGKGASLALGGAAVAAAAISVAVKGQFTALDEMGKMAQKVGVGVAALSRFDLGHTRPYLGAATSAQDDGAIFTPCPPKPRHRHDQDGVSNRT